MVNPKFVRRFSLGHADDAGAEHSSMARVLLLSSSDLQQEIADVYFGRSFSYHYNGAPRRYGDVMGKEASNGQVRDLLEMQEKSGIPISLTINEMNFMPEIVGDRFIRAEFVKFIKSFYDAGVRVCTISDIHLMSSGVLQEAMPEMHWKNTVNHIVRSAQEVVDYAKIGYQTILVDRSLNRDVDELKRVKRVAEKIGVKISMLASEGCMPSCPFKREHDSVQPYMQNGFNPTANAGLKTYWGVFGDLSCNRWRMSNMERVKDERVEEESLMPRQGTDIVALDKETMDLYLDNTDVLKFSGRLSGNNVFADGQEFVWGSIIGRKQMTHFDDVKLNGEVMAATFSEVYERNLWPFHSWRLLNVRPKEGTDLRSMMDESQGDLYTKRRDASVWSLKKARALNATLTTCKNQCYDCHACERVFGYKDVDSLLDIKSTAGWSEKADNVIPIFAAD